MTAATSTWGAAAGATAGLAEDFCGTEAGGAGATAEPIKDWGEAEVGGAGGAEAGPPRIEDMMLPKMLIAALLMP
jgi:hypothetical protein